MTRRSHAPAISAATNTHITNSDFVEPEAKPIPIPRDVKGPTRKRVRELINQNPHLINANLAAVVRLAKLEEQQRDLEKLVEEQGPVVEDRLGGLKKNPAMALLLQVHGAIVRQEHALAISIPARKESVSKAEEKMQRGGPRPGTRKNQDGTTSPRLKLA